MTTSTPTLTVGTITMNALPAGLSVFYFNKLVDWDTVTDSKTEVRERPQADGAYGISQDWRTSAVVSVEGWYSGASRADVKAAKSALRAAMSTGVPIKITLDDIDGRFSRTVSVRNVSIPDSGASPVFTFAIDTVAEDPLMYGDDIVQVAGVPVSGGGLVWPLGTNPTKYWDWGADGTSGRISVTNTGGSATFPLLQVSGGLAGGFIVTDQTKNRVVRLDRVVPQGSVVTVNQRTGVAILDGQAPVSGSLTRREFFSIGPGETHVIQFSPLGAVTGTPQLTMRTAPAN